jgi:MFS family permease
MTGKRQVSADRRLGTLATAFVAKNLAMSVTFGVYGLLIPHLEIEFQGSLSSLTLGIALVSLMLGLLGPAVGYLLDRWSPRGTLALGCLVAAIGLAGAATAREALAFNLFYGVVLGAGTAAAGAMTAAKLAVCVSRGDEGRSIGLAMLPVSSLTGPALLGSLLVLVGWRSTLVGVACALVILAACIPFLVTRPVAAGRSADATPGYSSPDFRVTHFVLAVGIACCFLPMGIVVLTFIAPMALNAGSSQAAAVLYLSIAGLMSLVGAGLFPWLADHIRPGRSLALIALSYLSGWLLVAAGDGVEYYWLAAALLGLAGGGGNPAISTFLAKTLGNHQLGGYLGRMALVILPLNVLAAPLAGWLYDTSGTYHVLTGLGVAVCLLALLLSLRLDGGRVQAQPV